MSLPAPALSCAGRRAVLRQVPAVIAAAAASSATRPASPEEPAGLAQAHAPGGIHGGLDPGVDTNAAAVVLVAIPDVIALPTQAIAALMVQDVPPRILLDRDRAHLQALPGKVRRPRARGHHALDVRPEGHLVDPRRDAGTAPVHAEYPDRLRRSGPTGPGRCNRTTAVRAASSAVVARGSDIVLDTDSRNASIRALMVTAGRPHIHRATLGDSSLPNVWARGGRRTGVRPPIDSGDGTVPQIAPCDIANLTGIAHTRVRSLPRVPSRVCVPFDM